MKFVTLIYTTPLASEPLQKGMVTLQHSVFYDNYDILFLSFTKITDRKSPSYYNFRETIFF